MPDQTCRRFMSLVLHALPSPLNLRAPEAPKERWRSWAKYPLSLPNSPTALWRDMTSVCLNIYIAVLTFKKKELHEVLRPREEK